MLEDIKLNIQECENLNLSNINVDWDKFNLACVKYFNKWRELTRNVNLKTFSIEQPIERQVKNAYDGYFYGRSNDIFFNIKELYNKELVEDAFMLPEKAYNWYNSDISDEFSIIPDVISQIETAANLSFGHVKLRYVSPRNVEKIHVDHGDYRYHVPIVTNDNAFFVTNNQLFHMNNSKKLYKLNTTTPHTVVNAAGSQGRLHLIATNKTVDYTFTNEKLKQILIEYINSAEEKFKNITVADYTLNKDLYKEIKIIMLSLKKLNKL